MNTHSVRFATKSTVREITRASYDDAKVFAASLVASGAFERVEVITRMELGSSIDIKETV